MKLEFNKKGAFCLPQKELSRALDGAREGDLKVLLMLCAMTADGSLDTDECKSEILTAVGIDEGDYDSALAYWRGARVLKLKKNEKDKSGGIKERSADENPKRKTLPSSGLPNYTEDEMAKKIESSGTLGATIDECQQMLGKIFTPADTTVIVGLADRLALSGEYITLLVAYCVGIGKRSLRYIEKTACEMFDEGIDDAAKLADYIKRKERVHEALPAIKRMVGAAERELTAKENALAQKWIGEYDYDIEVIRLAYERAVPKVEKGSFMPYMGGILDRWFKQGLKSYEDISAMLASYSKSRSESTGSFDTDDAFEKAIEKTMRRMTEKKDAGA